ncbi:MAG: T9SS type A sorting domain-containing protein [Crocinitomicaceae bacterium]
MTSNSEEQLDYSIYSMDGKPILVGVMNNGTTSIKVDRFAPGKYFTKIGAKVIAFEVTQ